MGNDIQDVSSYIALFLLVLLIVTFIKSKFPKKFPVFLEDQPTSDGAVCLQMIAKYYGHDYRLEYLLDITKTDPQNGVSMLGVCDAAEILGFQTMGVRTSFRKLKVEAVLPAILHLPAKHFIVVYKVTNSTVFVCDPSVGRMELSVEDFCDRWFSTFEEGEGMGLAIVMAPDYIK
ncbi:MAG: hypothetical protein GY757_40035 [bacterium]|nr:hypothetical protein [bacterium]